MTPADDAQRRALYARYEQILAEVTPPFAFVDLDALRENAAALLAQSRGLPIRVASKSVRSVGVLRRILALDPRLRGVLAFTAPEALHLVREGFDDIVIAYPSVDRAAIAEVAELAARGPERAPTLMVDGREQLDLIDEAVAPRAPPVPVCLDIDAGWWPLGGRLARIGPKRSPIREPAQARRMAEEIAARHGSRLAGLMAYEGQIAGVGDRVPGKPARSLAIRAMQAASEREIRARLPEVVAAVRDGLAASGDGPSSASTAATGDELELVNGGGTGSLARTAAAGIVTEVTAGSGFYAPALFDTYRSLDLTPAAFFVLPVVRRPGPAAATLLGGGYVASGPAGADRLPQPYLPAGLRLDRQEGAGEVQTPLLGSGARGLGVGDRVYLRHAKAGELCERFESLYLVEGGAIVDEAPTYRGAGHAFL